MSSKNEIRVPRTTAMFVRVLGLILRDHLKLELKEHEHWTFEHVGNWESGGRRASSIQKYPADTKNNEQQLIDWLELVTRSEFECSCWVGQGEAKPYKFGVRIERTEANFLAYYNVLYMIAIWLKDESGCIKEYYFQYGHHSECLFECLFECLCPMPVRPRRFDSWINGV